MRAIKGSGIALVASALVACHGRIEDPSRISDAAPPAAEVRRARKLGGWEQQKPSDPALAPTRANGGRLVPATAHDAGATPASATAPSAAAASSGMPLDRFGVRMLYPTTSSGREWYLPDDAEQPSSEWNVESNKVTRVSAGVFHTVGADGEVRLSVASPRGRAWWRNVELTGYFRYTAAANMRDQVRHWELLARGERHADGNALTESINAGVAAPSGTSTWPGYPFSTQRVLAPCLGTSYHGNFYPNGQGLFEKEVSHIDGYASQRGRQSAAGFADPLQRWFGLKFVARNADSDQRVHLELWLDANGDGQWQQLSQTDDRPATWRAEQTDINGCTAAPFSYAPDQLLFWAGPWVIFRSDGVAMDFRWLSAREIDPI